MANGSGSYNPTLILILGILSIVVCGPLGIAAWVMGNNALKELDQGFGDPNSRGLINAGRILGMIGVALTVIACVAWAAFMAVFGVAGLQSAP
ncbi:MAG: DUF4190 domain-containing protein [bacterium]|nr:DUF4190 domain-containing protein [bacterium]